MENSAKQEESTALNASLNNNEMTMEEDEDEKEAEKRKLVVKAVPKIGRIGGKRLNP